MVGNKQGKGLEEHTLSALRELLGYSPRKRYLPDIMNWKDTAENKRRQMQLEFAGDKVREERAAQRKNAGDVQKLPSTIQHSYDLPTEMKKLPEAKKRATWKD